MGSPFRAPGVACLALFVALGGAGYAALQLPKNSVGSNQIKRGAVKTLEIANNAVTGAKVRQRSPCRLGLPGVLAAHRAEGAGPVPPGRRGRPAQSDRADRRERRGQAGPAGSAGAYGYVNADGNLIEARSTGDEDITHEAGTGVYCVWIPGISFDSSVMMVGLDYANSWTEKPPPPSPPRSRGFLEVSYVPGPHAGRATSRCTPARRNSTLTGGSSALSRMASVPRRCLPAADGPLDLHRAHHPVVLVGENVAVVNVLAGEIDEVHADHDLAAHRQWECVG